jgi:sugar transferase (PEP-CTERM/EpsH1 system associated)
MNAGAPLHIMHIVHRLDVGGLENGLVNLINGMGCEGFRHTVVALTEATEFARRIARDDVEVHAIGKRPGKDLGAYVRLHRLIRAVAPDVVHTRNFGTLDCQVIAWLAGARIRIHGEHGWDVDDPDGSSARRLVIRKAVAPFVSTFVALSAEIERWLVEKVGVDAAKVVRICNGVDTTRFRPALRSADSTVVIGSIMRLEEIKDPMNVLDAFLELKRRMDATGIHLRLILVGDGRLKSALEQRAREAGAEDSVLLAGNQNDVSSWLARFDVFVLGSRREGISNTILEAMAAGLPVVATCTGGNPELVKVGETGDLVPPRCSSLLASAIERYARDDALRSAHGAAARERCLAQFSLENMIADYARLYRRALSR